MPMVNEESGGDGRRDVQALGGLLAHAVEGGVAGDALDAVYGVQVLAERELEDGEGSLAVWIELKKGIISFFLSLNRKEKKKDTTKENTLTER